MEGNFTVVKELGSCARWAIGSMGRRPNGPNRMGGGERLACRGNEEAERLGQQAKSQREGKLFLFYFFLIF
jgi:hypothetical protein